MEWSLFSNNRELIKTGRWEMVEDETRTVCFESAFQPFHQSFMAQLKATDLALRP